MSDAPQQYPTLSTLLAAQQKLPENMRSQCILLEFEEAVPKARCDAFYRIVMTRHMLDDGESEFHAVETWQPERDTRRQMCSTCRQPAAQMTRDVHRCMNTSCQAFAMPVASGPVRGVVRIVVPGDYLERIEETDWGDGTKTRTEYVDGCVLALDRRYDDATLAAVKRTAFMLGEMLGIKVK